MAKRQLAKYESGDIIGQRYRITGSLGAGGMASVWKAIDDLTQNEVAIKVAQIPAENENRTKIISRYNNELQSFLSLQTARNVVKLYDMIETSESLIIVMECVDGGTFTNRFRNVNDMNLDEIKFYFSRLCSALESTDRFNIVHRDLKPDNILISAEGEVKLGDYGIAIISESDLEAKTIIGTPKYMSPEACDGQTVTNLSDIYSLGIIMYETATGVPPYIFRSSDGKIQNKSLMEMQKYWKPLEPKKINKTIPQGLENLILQMIEKNPEFRPQTAEEVRKALVAIRTHDENVRPYLYRSKTFDNELVDKKNSRVGRTYDKLSSRFRSKFWITFAFLFAIILVAIVVELVVLI